MALMPGTCLGRRACPPQPQHTRQVSRPASLVVRALFNFGSPAAGPKAAAPRAQQLAQQLLQLSSGTDAGLKASQDTKEQIAKTVRCLICNKESVSDLGVDGPPMGE